MLAQTQTFFLDCQSDLTAFMYEILTYDQSLPPETRGSPEDIEQRMAVYQKIIKWKRTLPDIQHYQGDDIESYHHVL